MYETLITLYESPLYFGTQMAYDAGIEEAKFQEIWSRSKEESFEHLHKDIIPMLSALKKKDIRIGLISNCFSEEAMVIKKSILYPYVECKSRILLICW